MSGVRHGDLGETLPGRPDPAGLDAQLVLAQLREQMFQASATVQLGRHRLIRLLGRGAHGRVFEAEDTVLRRTLALKVLRADQPASGTDGSWLREAQSLAQLSHPHVVEVYDAGIDGEQLWIAMELVRGITMAEWARLHPPGSAARFERLRVILDQAASGVAAAHERGLVHRDLKPSNILVGEDGRARVADFGLARAQVVSTGSGPEGADEADARATAVAGTPRYMAPEQLRGERVDAASDQFGFAVTAWELAFGVHPFAGLEPSVLAHTPELRPGPVPDSSAVPAAYARSLRRALLPEPAERFASMEDMRRALRPRPRRRWLVGTAVGIAMLAAGAVVVSRPGGADPWRPSCESLAASAGLAEVWNDRRRASVDEGLRASGLPDAALVSVTVQRELDAFADDWVGQRVATCEAHEHAQTIDDARLDARNTCLRHAADAMDALLIHFEMAEVSVAARAIASVRSLPSPSDCTVADGRSHPRDPRYAALSTRLAMARAELAAGRYAAAVDEAEAIAAEATAAKLGTLSASAHEVAGIAWGELYDPKRFDAFESAYYAAAELTDGRDLARHANSLAMQHAYRGALDQAEQWVRHAQAGLRRYPDELQRLRALHVQGLVALRRKELAVATATFGRVLEQLDDRSAGTDELAWLAGLALMATHRASKRRAEVTALAEQLRQQTILALGPSHPRLARLSIALASSARGRGDFGQAIEHLDEAVHLSEQGYGPDNPRTGLAYLELGWTHLQAGDPAEAERCYRRGLAAAGEIDDPLRVRLLRGVAGLCSERDDVDCAEAQLRAAVSTGRRVWPEGSRELAQTERQLAEVLLQGGEPDVAARHLRATLEGQGAFMPAAERARVVVALGQARREGAEVHELEELRQRATAACGDSTPRSPWCDRLAAMALDEPPASGPATASGTYGRQ
ncbi:MAG: serine/threonine-protein kinase [Nannocystaceae bacterium]